MCAYALSSKLETLQARESTFPIQCMHYYGEVDLRACGVSNFRNKPYAHISFFVYPINMNRKAYVCV